MTVNCPYCDVPARPVPTPGTTVQVYRCGECHSIFDEDEDASQDRSSLRRCRPAYEPDE